MMTSSPPPKPRASLWSSFLWTAGFIGILAISYLTGNFFLPLLPQWVWASFFMRSLAVTSQYIPAVAVACWMVKYIKKESVGDYFGFRRCTARQLGLSLVLSLLFFLIAVAIEVAIEKGLSLLGIHMEEEELLKRAAVLLFVWPIVVFVGPLMEEVFFRGFYYRAMEQTNLDLKTSLFLNGLVFGLLHVVTIEGNILPYISGFTTFLGGVLLSWVRHKTGSIWPCIILHAGQNGIVVLVQLLAGEP